MAEILNQRLKGWRPLYLFVNYEASVVSYINRVGLWNLVHWRPLKYVSGMDSLMQWWSKYSTSDQNKALVRLVNQSRQAQW